MSGFTVGDKKAVVTESTPGNQPGSQAISIQDRIREVQRLSLAPDDKQKRIQKIMQEQNTSNPSRAFAQQSELKQRAQCEHYERKCDLQSPCCGVYFTCRFCHDADDSEGGARVVTGCTSKFDRFKVAKIKCQECHTEQEPSNVCVSCGIKFARSFCNICHVWTKDFIYHCDECGFCRVGKEGKNYSHCKQCDACFEEPHECFVSVRGATVRDEKCPICFELMFNSREGFFFMDCGHQIHHSCFSKSFNQHGNYKCPICKKSVLDMSPVWTAMKAEKAIVQMPEEYRDTKVKIACNDCGEESNTVFHVVGNECMSCGSFNTQNI